MFKIFQKAGESNVTFTHSLSADVGAYMDKKIPEVIIQKVTDSWIDKYGADVLDALQPKEMAKHVERAVKETMAKKIFGDSER